MTLRTGRRAALAVLCVALAGCAAEEPAGPDIDPAYRDRIDEVLKGDLPPAVRAALQDYHVSDAEYRGAAADFTTCVEEASGSGIRLTVAEGQAGYDAEQLPEFTDSFDTADEASAAVDVMVDRCARDGYLEIATYYWDMRTNPRALTHAESVVECWERRGVLGDEGLSAPELEEVISGLSPQQGFEARTPEGQACFVDPFKTSGG